MLVVIVVAGFPSRIPTSVGNDSSSLEAAAVAAAAVARQATTIPAAASGVKSTSSRKLDYQKIRRVENWTKRTLEN